MPDRKAVHVADIAAIRTARKHESIHGVGARVVRGGINGRHAAVSRDAGKVDERRQRKLTERRARRVEISHQMREDHAMEFSPSIVAQIRRFVERRREFIAGEHRHSIRDALENENVAARRRVVDSRHIEEGDAGSAAAAGRRVILELKAESGERLLWRRKRQHDRLESNVHGVRHELAPPCRENRGTDAVADLLRRGRSQHTVCLGRVVAGIDSGRS